MQLMAAFDHRFRQVNHMAFAAAQAFCGTNL
jgi:hypothetical protein